ncbi:MAG: Flp pilus assembly protein CpaB [bacterium]
MDKRLITLVAAAILIAGAATLVFYRLVSGRAKAQPPKPTAMLVVAARDLEIGTLIREPDVKLVGWTGTVPKGALTVLSDAIGRGVVSSVYTGEPVLDARLAPKGAGGGLAATIPPGMRAVAVRVNEIIGLAGFVTPGMRVDVLIAGDPPNGSKAVGTVSKTLLQNIEVLSAGQNIQKDSAGKPISVPVVNLLVTPEQAEILSLASTETKIQLVLRNPLDTEIAKTTGTAVANLFTGTAFKQPEAPRPRPVRAAAAPKPEPKPKPEPVVVEVFQGGKRTESKFEGTPED